MHQHSTYLEALSQLEEEWSYLEKLIAPRSESERSLRPNQESWSLNEMYEHLVIGQERIIRQVSSHGDGKPRTLLVRLFTAPLLKFIRFPVRLKVPIPEILPTGRVSYDALLLRRKLISELTRATCLSAPEAWSRNGVMNLPRWGWLTFPETIGFLTAHTHHHRAQAHRIIAMLDSDGNSALSRSRANGQ